MIDKKTGALTINGHYISPLYAESEFGSLDIANQARRSQSANGWTIYSRIEDTKIVATFRFKDSMLTEVLLCFKRNDAGGWEDWSENAELELKRKHDAWLEGMLGKPPYRYNWGEILSIYDNRAGASSVLIRYVGCGLQRH